MYENCVANKNKNKVNMVFALRQKEAKLRDYFEKIFPELKKHRDDKERLSRTGTRAGVGVYARSEAELEQIADGIKEQEVTSL